VLDDRLITFVRESLPPAPARLLEVGAGAGELAEQLRAAGYDVVAIDPAGQAPTVQSVRLHELDEPAASFDAAVAVVSLHHVEPLEESCRHLGTLVRSGGPLVVDEFDVGLLDVPAIEWWSRNRADDHHDHDDPAAIVAAMRAHLHPLERIVAALEPWFDLGPAERGPYLYRWAQRPDLREAEEREIEAGAVPATGARLVGRRS
jgi:SAM-dependent methyltransferase